MSEKRCGTCKWWKGVDYLGVKSLIAPCEHPVVLGLIQLGLQHRGMPQSIITHRYMDKDGCSHPLKCDGYQPRETPNPAACGGSE